MIGEVSHISEDGVWLSLRNRALLCWFLFLILQCLCYGQEKPPFDPSLVAPEKRIGRATATFSRHNSRAQIAVQTDAIQLVGNTEIGIILVPNFIVPGRKVVSPVSIELEFISYSHSKTFSSVTQINRLRNISKAACEARHRINSRSPGKTKRLCSVCASSASAMKTKPTGFSSVPPSGPAIPVTAKPKSVLAR